GLDAAVMNALDRNVERRTRSAAALAEQLEQVIQTAGDETLEAWAERALAEPRAQHRAWLAGVVGGRDAPRPMGRPTGSGTALAPGGPAPGSPPGPRTIGSPVAPAALPQGEQVPGPAVATHLAPDTEARDAAEPPPARSRRSLALALILALA